MCGSRETDLASPPRTHECNDCGEIFHAIAAETPLRKPIVNDRKSPVLFLLGVGFGALVVLTIIGTAGFL